MASRRQARWVPALPADSCQRLGEQTGRRPQLHARRHARHGDRFAASVCAFEGGLGSGGHVQAISACWYVVGLRLAVSVRLSGRFPVSNGKTAGFLKFLSY
jgi:hypothetical protein